MGVGMWYTQVHVNCIWGSKTMKQSNIKDMIWALRGSMHSDGTVIVKGGNGRGAVKVDCGIGSDRQSLKLRCRKCGNWENATEFLLKWSGSKEGAFGCFCVTCKARRRKDSMGRSIAVGKSEEKGYVNRVRVAQRRAIAVAEGRAERRRVLKVERNLVMRASSNDRRQYEQYAARKDALAMEGKVMNGRLRKAYYSTREKAFEAMREVEELDRKLRMEKNGGKL